MERCASLRSLDVSFNRLRTLAGLAGLVHLRELRAYNNWLATLDGLPRLSSLASLEVQKRGNVRKKKTSSRALAYTSAESSRLRGASS